MANHCPSCQKELVEDSVEGLCTPCLLKGLLVPEAGGEDSLETIGDYAIIREIARGGMGVVYEARQISLNRTVALKLIRDGRLASETEAERFRIEAEAAAELDHPNIVAVYEVGEESGQHYYSMRHVKGGSLAEHIGEFEIHESTPGSEPGKGAEESSGLRPQKKGKRGADAAASMILKIARAVQFAHQHGILHRDLKPANILIDEKGEPHVSDFGLAKRLGGESDLTLSGQVLGSPAYMSPEQAEGGRNLSTATDVYALGAILYHLLVQRPPFEGESPIVVMNRLITEEPELLRKQNSRIPRDLETICLTCLQKNSEKRYPSAKELADDIERFLRREPISARSVGTLGRLSLWAKRNPWIAGLTALLALLVILIAIGSSIFALNLSKAKSETQRELAQNLIFLATSKCEHNHDIANQLPRFHRAYTAAAEDADLRASALNLMGGWASTLGRCHLHGVPVNCVSFSPDGSRMLTGDKSGNVRIWDTQSGMPLDINPAIHTGSVHQIEFSPDGLLFATASEDGTAGVWIAESGEPFMDKIQHDKIVMGLSFSRDGRFLATGSVDQTCRIIDLQKRPLSPVIHRFEKPVISVDFHPRENVLAVACQEIGVAMLEVETGEKLHENLAQDWLIRTAAFSPDGETLAVGCFLDVASGQAPLLLFRSSTGEPIPVGDTSRGRAVLHYDDVSTMAFSDDSRVLVSAGRGGRVRFLYPQGDTSDAAFWNYGTVLRGSEACLSVAVSSEGPDGWWIALGMESGAIHVMNASEELSNRSPFHRTLYHRGPVHSLVFHPDNHLLASVSKDGTARIWDVQPWQDFDAQTGIQSGVVAKSVQFLEDKEEMLVLYRGNGDREFPAAAQSWNYRSGASTKVAFQHPSATAFTLAPDASSVFVGTLQGVIEKHTLPATTNSPVFSRRDYSVASLCVTPDLGTVLAGYNFDVEGRKYDSDLKIWDSQGRLQGSLKGHANTCAALATTAGGRLAASGSWDGTARIWNLATRTQHGSALAHQNAVDGLAFSGDGSLIATASRDRTARVWFVANSRAVTEPLPHDEVVRSVTFARDGKSLVTASSRWLRWWDVHTSQPLGPPFAPNTVGLHRVDLLPDGTGIIAFREDGIPRRWQTPPRVLDEPDRVRLWIEVLSGIDTEGGQALVFKDWLQKKRDLNDLGGPPLE